MGPLQYPPPCSANQGPRSFRERCCLLKDCERPFHPCQPQDRYCSEACQQAARRWRRWYASRRYRASTPGKERRRAQSQRYRERRRQQALALAAAQVASSASPVAAGAMAVAAAAGPQREGQRPARNFVTFLWRPCRRPGCYTLFPVQPRSPAQRFCSCSCRQALRRVLDREAHWRRRHRRPRAQPPRPSQPPPDSS